MILQRFAYTPDGTFGRIHMNDAQGFLYTVERPWLDNRPYESCVPEGEYRLLWRPTTTPVPDIFNGETAYLDGGTVGIDEGGRTRIAVHIANVPADVAGCIGLGIGLGYVKGEWAVVSSRYAMELAFLHLRDARALTIEYAPASGNTSPKSG